MSVNEKIKQEIVKLLKGGTPIKEIRGKYNISKSSIYNWQKQYESQPLDNFNISPRELYLLKKETEYLKNVVAIYDRAKCVKTSPLPVKLKAMTSLESEFSHALLCKTLDVKKGTFLNHLYRKVEETQVQKEDEIYKLRILELYNLHNGRLGTIKISELLRQEGFNCSQKRISRLMKELELKATRTVRAKKITIPQKNNNPDLKNILKRKFYPTTPNKAWVCDFSQFNIDYRQKYFICIIMDLFSRKVISFSIANKCTTDLLEYTFDKAYEKRKPKKDELIFHSDQGAQFLEFLFMKKLKELCIQQSFSKAGTPYDNAVIESFFSCLKREQLYINEINCLDDLATNVQEYINYYNQLRPHKTLKYKTPNQIESEYNNLK